MFQPPLPLATKEDVSTKTVASWVRKGCPHTRTKTGAYHFTLTEVQRWRAENLSPQASIPNTLHEARRRKETAIAELRELELRKRKGELVLRSEVEKRFLDIVRRARDVLQKIPDRVAGICAAATDQATIHAHLTKEIHQALEDLSS
jgi:hypothetical protein